VSERLPPSGLRRRIHELWRTIVHEHTAPVRVASAIVVGAVVGCTPLFGLHIVVCLALASLFRLNKLVVYGAANLSIPPLVPLIGFTSVQLGERIRHGAWMALHRTDFALANIAVIAKIFFVDWMIGGIVLGATQIDLIGDIEQAQRHHLAGLHPKFIGHRPLLNTSCRIRSGGYVAGRPGGAGGGPPPSSARR